MQLEPLGAMLGLCLLLLLGGLVYATGTAVTVASAIAAGAFFAAVLVK